MTKIWQLRALCLYLTLGIPLAASCAKEADTLAGDDTATGATTSSGGHSNTGGTTTTSAFGGTSSSSGAAGKTGAAGHVAVEGGSDSGTGEDASGGAGENGGGTNMVPPDVLARAKVIVLYQDQETAPETKGIRMKLNITNQSPDPLPMDHVKIRYWFTAEGSPTLHQYYVAPELGTHAAVFVNDAKNSHALMTFGGGGSIIMGGDINKAEVQLAVDSSSTSFNQADDFSWNPADVDSTPNDKITLYLDDKLIWGCEPSGACFDDATGGAGAGGAGAGGAGASGAAAGGAVGAGGAGGAP